MWRRGVFVAIWIGALTAVVLTALEQPIPSNLLQGVITAAVLHVLVAWFEPDIQRYSMALLIPVIMGAGWDLYPAAIRGSWRVEVQILALALVVALIPSASARLRQAPK